MPGEGRRPPRPAACSPRRWRLRAGIAPWRAAANALLLLLWPVAWAAPLAEAGFLPFLGGRELSVIGAVATLWDGAPGLALLVALLGMALPYGKALAAAALHLGLLGPRAEPVLAALARLSMADVFLVAIYVVVAKGAGPGYVAPSWGLWLFTGCVGLSIAVAWPRGQASAGRGGR